MADGGYFRRPGRRERRKSGIATIYAPDRGCNLVGQTRLDTSVDEE